MELYGFQSNYINFFFHFVFSLYSNARKGRAKILRLSFQDIKKKKKKVQNGEVTSLRLKLRLALGHLTLVLVIFQQ